MDGTEEPKLLVFQYGSNLCSARLNAFERLAGDATPLTLARTVEGFVLVFEVWSSANRCGAASIRHSGHAPVWGRLYEIPKRLIFRKLARSIGRKSLDQIEAEGKNYERIKLGVIRCDRDAELEAITYIALKPRLGLAPSPNYLGYIVQGLQECGAPTHYIDQVRRTPTSHAAS